MMRLAVAPAATLSPTTSPMIPPNTTPTMRPSTISSRTASSSVPNDAHQRPLIRLNERPMDANGPSRSSTSNGPARLNITPSQIPGRISAMNAITSTIPSTIPRAIDGSSRRRPSHSESLTSGS